MVDISKLTTLSTPTKAESVIEFTSPQQIQKLHSEGLFQKPYFILGWGANVLFVENFSGTIIKNNLTGFTVSNETADEIYLTVNSGHSWIDLVEYTVNRGWSGIENMALIPGTIGAAAVGNIAAYGQNFSDIFSSLTAFNLESGGSEIFTHDQCNYVYRSSIFKNTLKNTYFITTVTIRLSKHFKPEQSYVDTGKRESIAAELAQFATPPYTTKNISDAVIRLRTRKLPDWTKIGTAGSFFKNPVVDQETAAKIKAAIPDIQTYSPDKLTYNQPEHQTDYVKLPAGWLLDKLGWRGKKIGNVGTAENQALCIINYGQATGKEIYAFSQAMHADVLTNFNIDLDYEVVIV